MANNSAHNNKIRVLIIDDSFFFREALAIHLNKDLEIEVIGQAPDSYTAYECIKKFNPDVITVDVEMPGMNGIEFLRELIPHYSIPAVVVSSISKSVFDALDAGAVDFIAKPDTSTKMSCDYFINELRSKIKVAATANRSLLRLNSHNGDNSSINKDKIIVIGASTGGTEAIYEVIRTLPKNIPGIIIVQHMPAVFTKMYAERLNNSCMLEVKEAESNDRVLPGQVLIAPGDYHIKLKKAGSMYSVDCFRGEKINGHCPAVDVLFHSVAEKAGKAAIGIILTGMGSDGAKGLLAMRRHGARTIGQDEDTSIVYGMPKVAYDIGAVEHQVPLHQVGQMTVKILEL